MGDVEKIFSDRVSKDDPELIFQIVEVVGSGSFGTVCACRWMKKKDREQNFGRLIACKFVEVSADDSETNMNLMKEIDILKESIDCPFIVEYKGCYLKSSMLLIVMEYCKGGSLLDIIELCGKRLTEEEIAAVCAGVVKGLVYLHSKNTTHRDIKAGNILLDEEGLPKLADFGVSTIMEQGQKMKTVIGSPYWMAPEIIMGQGYDQKADIWSLGITAIEIAELVPPRFDVPPSRVIFTIPHQPPPTLKIPSDWSPEFNDFVKTCLSMNPANRPSAKSLLSHPFILKGSSQQILQRLVTECIPILKEKRSEKIKQMEEQERAAQEQQQPTQPTSQPPNKQPPQPDQAAMGTTQINVTVRSKQTNNYASSISAIKADQLKGSVIVLNSNTKTASIMRNKNPPPTGRAPTGTARSVNKSVLNRYPQGQGQQPQQPATSTHKGPIPNKVQSPFLQQNNSSSNLSSQQTTKNVKSAQTANSANTTVKPTTSANRSTISIGQQKSKLNVQQNQQEEESSSVIYYDNSEDEEEEDQEFNHEDYEEVQVN